MTPQDELLPPTKPSLAKWKLTAQLVVAVDGTLGYVIGHSWPGSGSNTTLLA